jgi:CheY-like chemotaxis protein
MRIEELTPAHVRRAIELYMELAWPQGSVGREAPILAELGRARTLEELLSKFEQLSAHEQEGSRSYLLRLGNLRYPFMKFAVQEYLVDGEFFFAVDTHDNLDVRANAPDFALWQELKLYNRAMKECIEGSWREAGLPTFDDLRTLCEGLAPVEREPDKRVRIALVDDEKSVAIGLGALLRGRGYDVELFHSGESVLERLQHLPSPDLLILDYELPALDGEAVLTAVRADPALAKMPVLMATASSIQLERLGPINGFLRKPYPRRLLFATIAQLTTQPPRSTPRAL